MLPSSGVRADAGGVDRVNIYPAEERPQHSAEASDDFKMSFSSSLPCNSATATAEAALKAKTNTSI